ncbi:MAG: 1-(5-phosphoribosyl)-5-amino-4-imidazole-carboxylate carboxylase, partial [Bacteroidales bacterium]
MTESQILELLKNVKEGNLELGQAVNQLKQLPFEDLGYAKVDHHREIRTGYPEVIFCPGKTNEQIRGIVERLLAKGTNIMVSRVEKSVYEAIKDLHPDMEYYPEARTIFIQQKDITKSKSRVLVVTGGTSDIPVAEEAVVTAEKLGCTVERLYDVGVAGIHRLLANRYRLDSVQV